MQPRIPGLVEGVPAHGRGVGTRWSLRSLPALTILWFYDLGLPYYRLRKTTLAVREGEVLPSIWHLAALKEGGFFLLLWNESYQWCFRVCVEKLAWCLFTTCVDFSALLPLLWALKFARALVETERDVLLFQLLDKAKLPVFIVKKLLPQKPKRKNKELGSSSVPLKSCLSVKWF